MLLTLGLGRRTPAEYQATLELLEADVVVDIRLVPDLPAAYPGDMTEALTVATGTPYLHRSGLGERIVRGRRLLRDRRELDMLAAALRTGKTMVLVCGCEALTGCHRDDMARLMIEAMPGLEVQHL